MVHGLWKRSNARAGLRGGGGGGLRGDEAHLGERGPRSPGAPDFVFDFSAFHPPPTYAECVANPSTSPTKKPEVKSPRKTSGASPPTYRRILSGEFKELTVDELKRMDIVGQAALTLDTHTLRDTMRDPLETRSMGFTSTSSETRNNPQPPSYGRVTSENLGQSRSWMTPGAQRVAIPPKVRPSTHNAFHVFDGDVNPAFTADELDFILSELQQADHSRMNPDGLPDGQKPVPESSGATSGKHDFLPVLRSRSDGAMASAVSTSLKGTHNTCPGQSHSGHESGCNFSVGGLGSTKPPDGRAKTHDLRNNPDEPQAMLDLHLNRNESSSANQEAYQNHGFIQDTRALESGSRAGASWDWNAGRSAPVGSQSESRITRPRDGTLHFPQEDDDASETCV